MKASFSVRVLVLFCGICLQECVQYGVGGGGLRGFPPIKGREQDFPSTVTSSKEPVKCRLAETGG